MTKRIILALMLLASPAWSDSRTTAVPTSTSSLTCGAGTQGLISTKSTGELQYCDGATPSVLHSGPPYTTGDANGCFFIYSTSLQVCWDGTEFFIDTNNNHVMDITERNLLINAPDSVGNQMIHGTLTVVDQTNLNQGPAVVAGDTIDTNQTLFGTAFGAGAYKSFSGDVSVNASGTTAATTVGTLNGGTITIPAIAGSLSVQSLISHSAGGNWTLTNASVETQWVVSGASTTRYKLPVNTTMLEGRSFQFVNDAAGVVTIYSSDDTSVVATLAQGNRARLVLLKGSNLGTSDVTPAAWAVFGTKASGTVTLNPSSLGAFACMSSGFNGSAPGVLTTDTIEWTPSTDLSTAVGYGNGPSGTAAPSLSIYPYPTGDNVNFKVCNVTNATVSTIPSIAINWRVIR